MDIAWDQYKPLLRKAYFGDFEDCIAPRDSDTARDFWAFFKKYLTVAARKRVQSDRDFDFESTRTNESGFPTGAHVKYHRENIKIHLDKTSKYTLREVPKHVVREFEHIVHCYMQFCQRQRHAKLRKLRQAQANLPIAAERDRLVEAVKENSVVIVAGDTGCGKSTQVPQYLLAAGFEKVACTQPRRIACISLCKRVAHETLNEYGSRVAFQIRFERTKTINTKLLFLTEGLLLRQMAAEASLQMYDVIILDEVHERNLHGDLLMGLLRMLGVQRPDFKLILMSATINLNLFSAYFPDAPVIQVPGRLYPIELQYKPVPKRDARWEEEQKRKGRTQKIDPTPYIHIMQMIDHKYPKTERGDMLVFLSGINEIQTVGEQMKLYAEQNKTWIILMLHSTLSLEEQDKVFDVSPDGVRKCVLTTNIAETSVTIDGIRFVVDSGKVKEMRYDAQTRMHALKETNVSQASAEQRKGRAGRTGPGVCYRLYSPEDFAKFDPFTPSEIQRVSLESIVMQLYNLDLGVNPRHFPFIEKPDPSKLEEAIECLRDQGVLILAAPPKTEDENDGVDEKEETDEKVAKVEKEEKTEKSDESAAEPLHLVPAGQPHETLSDLGHILVNLPVDIEIGKMLVMACMFRQVEALLTAAASLSLQSVFTNRSYRDCDCAQARANLMSSHGDTFTVFNVYREWTQLKLDGRESTRTWCRRRGIEEQRLYEVTKLREQFRDLLEDGDLIEKVSLSDSAKGSAARRLKAGEMKRFKELKRKARTEQRKRKMLKADEHYDSVAKDDVVDQRQEESNRGRGVEAAQAGDVASVEFDMRHNQVDLVNTVRDHQMSHGTSSLVKYIVCAGLYPQYGILDQHNSYRVGNDITVHVRHKPYVILHPNGALAHDPECFQITLDQGGYSANHQAVFYAMLLETTKPYVVNAVRVPALHTLIVLARKVDWSTDFGRVVVDDFIEFTLRADSGDGELLWRDAKHIRTLWTECVQRKVTGDSFRSDKLACALLEFAQKEIVYSMKRLQLTNAERVSRDERHLPADRFSIGTTPDDSSSSYAAYLATQWTCANCGEPFMSTAEERLKHVAACVAQHDAIIADDKEQQTADADQDPEADVAAKLAADRSLRRFACDKCAQVMALGAVDILRHRRSCAAEGR